MSVANPYAPPTARVEDLCGDPVAAEATRREHIAHETSIRALGLLCVIGGILMLVRAGWILMFGMTFGLSLLFVSRLIVPFLLVTGALSIAAGVGILQLRLWARVPAVALLLVGLLAALIGARVALVAAPITALIGACFLLVLFAGNSRRLFAPDYRAIVAATPQVKYRVSILLCIVLAVAISVFGMSITVGL